MPGSLSVGGLFMHGCDGSPDGNVVVISLPDRDSGSMPSIEWLT